MLERPLHGALQRRRAVDADDDELAAPRRVVVDDRHRAGCLVEHLAAHGTEHQATEAAHPAGADHEQRGVLRRVTQRRAGQIADGDATHVVVAAERPGDEPGEHADGGLLAVLRVERITAALLVDGAPRHHRGDGLVVVRRELDGAAQRGTGVRRLIDADDDAFHATSISIAAGPTVGPKGPTRPGPVPSNGHEERS